MFIFVAVAVAVVVGFGFGRFGVMVCGVMGYSLGVVRTCVRFRFWYVRCLVLGGLVGRGGEGDGHGRTELQLVGFGEAEGGGGGARQTTRKYS